MVHFVRGASESQRSPRVGRTSTIPRLPVGGIRAYRFVKFSGRALKRSVRWLPSMHANVLCSSREHTMKSQSENPESLFHALEARGWVWENERLYAPNGTFWTQGTKSQSTPLGMLLNMRERMKVALANLKANKPTHLNQKQYEDWLSDMGSLVNTIEELLENQNVR